MIHGLLMRCAPRSGMIAATNFFLLECIDMFLTGAAMLVAFVLLYVVAIPRHGQPRTFFGSSYLVVSFYTVGLVTLLIGGVALVIAGLA